MNRPSASVVLALALAAACGGDEATPAGPADGSVVDGAPLVDGDVPLPDGSPSLDASVTSKARLFTERLGGGHADHFLVGVGNDGTNDGKDDAYGLGVTLDLHYHYLNGLSTSGGWVTWNQNPDYVAKRIAESRAHAQVPMLTYYCFAANGDRNLSVLTDATFLKTYFKDFSQALASIKAAGGAVVVHDEPDFWGYMLQETVKNGGDPTKIKVLVSQTGVAECAGEPDDVVGLAHCKLKLYRTRAPNALVGFHASAWGTTMDVDRNRDPKFDVVGEAGKTVAFYKTLGFDKADYVASDPSDRDAGCYEANHLPMCECIKTKTYQCDDFYWDESNATLPNFKQHLTWVKAVSDGLRLPVIWWQIPYGSPSGSSGAVGAWRDNRVHYFFAHIDELVAAGGVGAVWGVGAGDQSYLTPEFKTAVTKYFNAPFPLP